MVSDNQLWQELFTLPHVPQEIPVSLWIAIVVKPAAQAGGWASGHLSTDSALLTLIWSLFFLSRQSVPLPTSLDARHSCCCLTLIVKLFQVPKFESDPRARPQYADLRVQIEQRYKETWLCPKMWEIWFQNFKNKFWEILKFDLKIVRDWRSPGTVKPNVRKLTLYNVIQTCG